ncbi:MAG: putative methyltransferase [Thermoplasmata archaeon]|nr:MAG: putative methyltransferase [Thermoplasmata archaeon]
MMSLLSNGTVSVWKLLDMQDASLPEFFEKLQEMERKELIKIKNGKAEITEKGQRSLDELKWENVRCSQCEGTGYEILKEIEKDYERIVQDRPPPIEAYDQGYMSNDGVLRKVSFMMERGDLYANIFVIGDDDLFSIASALTHIPKKIVVVDIDERIINFINDVAENYDLKIEGYILDLRKENENFLRKFDVFVTDPVETLPGIKLFLSRGASSLKGMGSGYFGLSTLEASRRKWYKIQKMIHDMGFVITDIRRQFSVYPDDGKNFFKYQEKLPIVKKLKARVDYNWYKSSLYRIEAIKKPKPLIEGNVILGKKFYVDDESWATPM